jgi:hypothetical protein
VSQFVALIAEPDRALRDLMRRTLMVAGYQVFESSNVLQLEIGLRALSVFVAPNLLFVLGAQLAKPCVASISSAARERGRVGLAPPQLVLTYEFGNLATSPDLDLAPCLPRGSLEKPFDLYDLQTLAVECRLFQAALGANGASA